jgi:hypothetical protein
MQCVLTMKLSNPRVRFRCIQVVVEIVYLTVVNYIHTRTFVSQIFLSGVRI